jgi:hypothetical protein
MRVFIEGIGLCGPGLDGWGAGRVILNGSIPYEPTPTNVPAGALLPANERRRAVQTVRIALAVGAEALVAAGRDPGITATVFASSGGDGETIHQILSALATPQPALSPTRFHNSVHNTPAGYWGIATGSRAASSSLCCHDDSFAAGLLEACVHTTIEQQAVALITYDVCYPAPLSAVRPIGAAFAVALVLAPERTDRAVAGLEIDLRPASEAHYRTPALLSAALEDLRWNTPAARSLPLLAALASGAGPCLALNYLDDLVLDLRIVPIDSNDEGGQEKLDRS